MTRHGVGMIRSTGGGGVDRNGRPVPEQFPPDPYALRTPAEALAHYASFSGEDRNYYFNKVDTSHVKPTDFPEVVKIVAEGKPGLHQIKDAAANYPGGLQGKIQNLTSAATVGRLNLRMNGVLAIARDGSYRFNGRLGATDDVYDFNADPGGRSPKGELSTTVGRQIPGKTFMTHVIGSKPFSFSGRRMIARN